MSLFIYLRISLWLSAALQTEAAKFDFANAAEMKLVNVYGQSRDRFGGSVSLDREFVVIGSPDSSPSGQESGSAFIYKNVSTNSSNIPQELSPSNKIPREGFGSSTSLYGGYVAIGAPKYNLFAGAVFIYAYSGYEWSETQMLQASDHSRGDYFGFSVALSARFLVVGANSKDELKGSVYVFARTSDNGYVERELLMPFDSHEYQKFGHAVAIADSFIIVGAVGDNSKGQYSHGAVYVYERSSVLLDNGHKMFNWTRLSKLYANTPKDLSNYGQAVAISRHISSLNDPFLYTLIVGCDNDDSSGVIGSGAVYVYLLKAGSITYASRIYASDPKQDAFFGYSISVNSGHFLIGAPGYGSPEVGPECGAAYLFEASTSGSKWTQKMMFVANDTKSYARFGVSVAIFEGVGLVGADQATGVDINSGAAYLFSPEFAKPGIGKKPIFWSENPEEDILVILTILPFAVLIIPLLVVSCVYGFNSNWVYIEGAFEKITNLCSAEDLNDSSSQSSRGLISNDSSHSSHDGSPFGQKQSPRVIELPQQSEFHGAVVRPNLSTMDLSQCPMLSEHLRQARRGPHSR